MYKRKLMIALAFILVAFGTRTVTVLASDYYDYYSADYNNVDYYDFDYNNYYTERAFIESAFDRVIVAFDPNPGAFPASEVADGLRFPNRGETLAGDDFPPNPIRNDGYVFSGWRLPDGSVLTATYLIVNDQIELSAIWERASEAPDATPSPSPSPSPEPGASPSPSPVPGTSPSPSPSPAPATPSPTPNPDDKAQDGYRPNPGTNPITISFLIFGAVIGLGIAAYYIVKLTAQHATAKGQYRTDATRYKRESRLTEFLEEDDLK